MFIHLYEFHECSSFVYYKRFLILQAIHDNHLRNVKNAMYEQCS
jgi:hypothetical protein